MEITFNSKRALVTGAGKGIGRAIAKKLSECGAETIALSRTQSDLDSLKTEVPGISIVQADLRDWDGTRKTLEKIGPIDLLVNNAAVGHAKHFLDAPKEDIDLVFDVNFKAVFNVSQVVAKGMVARGQGGSIVNVSSLASLKPMHNHAVYGSAKAGVDMLTKVMALELGPHKIRVNVVNPTVVWTDMAEAYWGDPVRSEPILSRTPLGKFAEIEDVVNSVIFLLSDKSAMTNGVLLPIDGGHLIN